MKRLVLLSLLSLGVLSAKAQYTGGFEFGGNIMSANFSISEELETKSSWGIRLGYVGEYSLPGNLYFRGAALINQRGFQYADERWGLNAFDVPLNLGYLISLSDNGPALFVDGGINFEYNFRAFTKINDELVTLSIGSEEQDIKPFSTGFNVGTGVKFNERVKLRINYYHGLTNLVRTDGDEWKNRVVGLALNCFFGK